jgi:thioredoxin-disulfide reductase
MPMETKDIFDVIIVGGGPAGMSAAIYCKRKLLKTLVITKEIGGQVVLTGEIENYLGYIGRSGLELGSFFEQQVKQFGVEIVLDEVMKIEADGELFNVAYGGGSLLTKAVIITGGSEYRKLNVPGEETFFGRGVSVCATCDSPFARDRTVAIIGGGNTALQSAELLARYAKKVYLIHRREDFRADELLCERARNMPNIQMVMNSWITEIKGAKKVESITIKDVLNNSKSELEVDMVFVEIGRVIKVDYVKDLVKTDDEGRVIVDSEQRTNCPGIFAAGDITDRKYGQAIIAAGDGAVAALSAHDYIKEKEQSSADVTCELPDQKQA